MENLLQLCEGQVCGEELPLTSPRTIYFFVCSSYTDFALERRILRESICNDLRTYAREKYGLDVCVVDPRCLEAAFPLELVDYERIYKKQCLHYCKDDVNCCNIILFGQKHGLPLLPKTIPFDLFRCIQARIEQKTNNPLYPIVSNVDLQTWYQLDTNCRGKPVWCLNCPEIYDKNFGNQSVEEKLELVEHWTKQRDFVAWTIYHITQMCVQENILTMDEAQILLFNDLEYSLSKVLQSCRVNKESVDTCATTNKSQMKRKFFQLSSKIKKLNMFEPIFIHRQIVDIHNYLSDSIIDSFVDLIPPVVVGDAEHGEANERLMDYELIRKHETMLANVEQCLTKQKCSIMKILWRSPLGINRQFHKDYLDEFTTRIREEAFRAIDTRAWWKITLMLPSLFIDTNDVDYQNEDKNCKIVLPQLWSKDALIASEFRRHIRLWDNVWNSLNQARWLAPFGIVYRNDIDTVFYYIEDTDQTTRVPMFLYSVQDETQNRLVKQISPASAVAISVFQQIQCSEISDPFKPICVIRIFTKPTLITDLLDDLVDQFSFIFDLDRQCFNNESFAELLFSITEVMLDSSKRLIILFLVGIEQIFLNDNEEHELLPLLQSKQLPPSLSSNIKVILAGTIKTLHFGSQLNTYSPDKIVLPSMCLNLQINQFQVTDAYSACLNRLAELDRTLSDGQVSQLYQLVSQFPIDSSDMHIWMGVLIENCLQHVKSFECVSAQHISTAILPVNMPALFEWLGTFVGQKTCTFYLVLLSLVSNRRCYSAGLTMNELYDLMNLELASRSNDVSHQTCYDPFGIWLCLDQIQNSVCSRYKVQPMHSSLDGYFVYQFSIDYEFDLKLQIVCKNLLLDYFASHSLRNVTPTNSKQDVYLNWVNIDGGTVCSRSIPQVLNYNVRYLRHIGSAYLNTNQFECFAKQTIFNFDWLYGQICSLGSKVWLIDCDWLINRIRDTDHESNITKAKLGLLFEATLLQDCLFELLDESGSTWKHPQSLSTDLMGLLFPFALDNSNVKESHCQLANIYIDYLMKQCQSILPHYNMLMPNYSYPITPDHSLLVQISCCSKLLNVLDWSSHRLKTDNYVLVKLENDANIYRYDWYSGKQLDCWKTSQGHLHLTPNRKFAIILDEMDGETLKIHQTDVELDGTWPLIGQINVAVWIKSTWTNPSSSANEGCKLRIIKIELTDSHVGLIVRASNTRHFVNDMPSKPNYSLTQHLSPNNLNHVIIFELVSGKLIHLLRPSPMTSLVKLVRLQYANSVFKQDLFFINSASQLMAFDLLTGHKLFSVGLENIPNIVVYTPNGKRLFVTCHQSTSIFDLKLNMYGQLEQTTCLLPISNLVAHDEILNIRTSDKCPFLIIHAKKIVIVYNYITDGVLVKVERPANFADIICLPNSKCQKVYFTSALFGLDDQVVLISIFRYIQIWDIGSGQQLGLLCTDFGIVTRLLVDVSQQYLVGYVHSNKTLYVWNLPRALKNKHLIKSDLMTNRMDCMTKPIKKLVQSPLLSNLLVAICDTSNEMGLFDTNTGNLTHLLTHNGHVSSVHLTACGKYALVGLKLDKQFQNQTNLIWDLQSRSVLFEYGNHIGYCIECKQKAAHFFHLMPQFDNECQDYQPSCYTVLSIKLKNGLKVAIQTIANLKFMPIFQTCRPFITNDDRHLVCLTTRHGSENYLSIWSLDDNNYDDNDDGNGYRHEITPKGTLWFIEAKDLSVPVDNECTLIAKNIVFCLPTCQPNVILVHIALSTNQSQVIHYGIGFIRLLKDCASSRQWTYDYFKLIWGFSRLDKFYFSFTKSALFDCSSGRYYQLSNSTDFEIIDLNQFKWRFEVGQNKNGDLKVKCYGFVCCDDIIVFTCGTCIYLIRTDTGKLVGMIDRYHTIRAVCKDLKNDRIIYLATSDGYILSYSIMDFVSDYVGGTKPVENKL